MYLAWFYYDSHRAMFDVDALIHLVTYNVEGLNNAVLELLINATKPTYKIIALNSDFDKKDLLKTEDISGMQRDIGGKI